VISNNLIAYQTAGMEFVQSLT